MKISERFIDDGIYMVPPGTIVLNLQDSRGNPVPTRKEVYEMGGCKPRDLEPTDEILVARLSEHSKHLADIISKNPNWRLAHAYETQYCLFLSQAPEQFTGSHVGSGFNYGSTNCLWLPRGYDGYGLLIVAEND